MQLEDRRVFSHGIGHFDVFSAPKSFVSTNVADDLNTRIPRRVLLDQEADRGREARREAAGREDGDFRLRRGSGLVRARGRSLGVRGGRGARRRRLWASGCRATGSQPPFSVSSRNAKHRVLFARFERQGSQRPAAATKTCSATADQRFQVRRRAAAPDS